MRNIFRGSLAVFSTAACLVSVSPLSPALAGEVPKETQDATAQRGETAPENAGDSSKYIDDAAKAFSAQLTRAFERRFRDAVIQALAVAKPVSNGKPGEVAVRFIVSETGELQDLKVVRSSGNELLDQVALSAVRQARIPAPPSGLPQGDRTFTINYISK